MKYLISVMIFTYLFGNPTLTFASSIEMDSIHYSIELYTERKVSQAKEILETVIKMGNDKEAISAAFFYWIAWGFSNNDDEDYRRLKMHDPNFKRLSEIKKIIYNRKKEKEIMHRKEKERTEREMVKSLTCIEIYIIADWESCAVSSPGFAYLNVKLKDYDEVFTLDGLENQKTKTVKKCGVEKTTIEINAEAKSMWEEWKYRGWTRGYYKHYLFSDNKKKRVDIQEGQTKRVNITLVNNKIFFD